MNLLALDSGTKLGFALWRDGEITSGTQKLCHDRNASGVRFLHFRRWLMEIIETYNIRRVFFERVYGHKGTDAAHIYGAFMYLLAAVCEEMHIKCTGFPVGTIKKFMTGKGNATKEEMIEALRQRGFDPVDDNEADSLAILFLSISTLSLKNSTISQTKTGPPWGRGAALAARPALR
jgi:Holliday junction resolvasome RuvABC endonuclease subunit